MKRIALTIALLLASTPAFATHIVQLAATSGKVTPLAMPIGEDANLVVTVVDSTGAARDVTGSIFTLTIRHRATDVDAIVARVCTSSAPATGIVNCSIAQSDSNAMTSRMDGFYDVWEEDASGNLTNTVPLSAFSFTPRIRNPADPLTTPVPPPLQVINGPAITNVEGDVLTEHSDGSVTWAAANGLPSQATHAGEALFTNGTTAAWSPIDFTAGGDLSGTLSAATVAKIQGHAVSATAPTDGQVLQYQAASTSYVPHTLTADDVGAVSSVGAGAGLLATGTTDVTVSMPAVGTAGTYGGGGQCIGSITTDAEGRVSALSTMTPASTLASAYSSTAANNIIGLNSSGGPVLVRDNATPLGSTLFGVQNNGGTNKYLDVTASQVSTTLPMSISGGGASFDANGKLTFASSSGSSGQGTITIDGPGASRPIAANITGLGGWYFNQTSSFDVNSTGLPFEFITIGTSPGFKMSNQGTRSSPSLTVYAVSNMTAPVLLVQGGTTPGTNGDLQEWEDSNNNVLDEIDASGNLSVQSVALTSTSAAPTCSSTTRGMLYVVQGGSGVTDTLEACLKAAAGTYAWHTVVTGG